MLTNAWELKWYNFWDALTRQPGNRLLADGGFPLSTNAELFIRVRATDSGGLFAERTFVLSAKRPSLGMVINEIHYNPINNTIREEFIELHNPSNAPVNLQNWRLRGGVDFVFSNSVNIAAGGYVVVAANPATIQARYGVSALGPWSCNLSSDGERVTLRNPADDVIDEVDYRSEFPWPIAANSGGCSMELLNPALDNDLGSSWASPLSPMLPSPGMQNRTYLTNGAPNIRQVDHSIVPFGSVDAGLFFDRPWMFRDIGYFQTLEPRLFYVRIPYRDQSQLPNFSTAEVDFGASSLFRENRFIGGDRVGDANQITAAVTSRLVESATGVERLKATLGQVYYFDPPRVTLDPATPQREGTKSDVVALVSGQVTPHFNLEGSLEYRVGVDQHERVAEVEEIGR